MRVNVKCSSNGTTLELDVEANAKVIDFKGQIAEQVDVPPAQQRLIYSGKVLKDPETLESYQVQEGHTIHMVRGAAPQRPAPAPAPATPAPAPAAATTPNPMAALGLGGAGLGAPPGAGLFNPFGAVPMAGQAAAAGVGAAGNLAPVGGLGGMGGLDPFQMMQMMQNPAMQQMATALMHDPQALQSVQQAMQSAMTSGSGGNPANFMQQMQQVMANPVMQQAMATMMQDPAMQQVMLQQMNSMMSGGGLGGLGSMDGLLGMGGMPGLGTQQPALGTGLPAGLTPPGLGFQGAAAAPTAAPPAAAPVGSPNVMGAAAPAAVGNPASVAPDFNAMLTSVLANMGQTGAPTQPSATTPVVSPEIRYSTQISQLCDMGFFDAEANLRALVATGGNVNAAVERLLSGG
mmetsp:Transcript_49685/g.82457  ORF Transcript_49685/g.82457 Transcript_49685/m.82457 type:complete len:403 (-) Transcript_49685:417-1625(-)|eukprot:CAMPEP_0119305202 /NCGR_PEP_ID=MMETSP1333-20130426/6245_1 /TAXON_ID=418940 /ORGANISM="Scyphosphaera apsteinii, Strain RCC1455" /LENGTH=402 /DNA_ID=CAMNT_0007308229 /DNA_START=56 /DNA_END=1264 /DNA_ORIENTATION=-